MKEVQTPNSRLNIILRLDEAFPLIKILDLVGDVLIYYICAGECEFEEQFAFLSSKNNLLF
jgi:hypothetical protein